MTKTVAVPAELLDQASKASGDDLGSEVVVVALREYIARRDRSQLLDLFDTLEWDPTYDYKAERDRS